MLYNPLQALSIRNGRVLQFNIYNNMLDRFNTLQLSRDEVEDCNRRYRVDSTMA